MSVTLVQKVGLMEAERVVLVQAVSAEESPPDETVTEAVLTPVPL